MLALSPSSLKDLTDKLNAVLARRRIQIKANRKASCWVPRLFCSLCSCEDNVYDQDTKRQVPRRLAALIVVQLSRVLHDHAFPGEGGVGYSWHMSVSEHGSSTALELRQMRVGSTSHVVGETVRATAEYVHRAGAGHGGINHVVSRGSLEPVIRSTGERIHASSLERKPSRKGYCGVEERWSGAHGEDVN